MKIIKLYERATVERQGKYGWEPETIYEPIYIVAEHIESMSFAGNTSLKMVSGEQIIVRETPEEIVSLLEVGVAA
ncbi:flagellar FlbD family protein [Citrobacter koseri]